MNFKLVIFFIKVELHSELENKIPQFLINKVNKHDVIEFPNEVKNNSAVIQILFGCCSPFRPDNKSGMFLNHLILYLL